MIYQHKPFPIYFPSPSIRFVQNNTFQFADKSVAAITNDDRILFWKNRGLGARELLKNKEPNAVYEFAHSEDWFYILEMTKEVLDNYNRHLNVKILKKLHAINLLDFHQSFEVDYSKEEFKVLYTKATYGRFYLFSDQRKTFVIDTATGKLEPHEGERLSFPPRDKVNFSLVKKWVNNGYTTLKRVKRMSVIIDEDNLVKALRINNWELKFTKHRIYFEQTSLQREYDCNFSDEESMKRGKTTFRKAMFPEESYAIADSNGLLHLISTNPKFPQVTIPMIVGGGYTAAWASDGKMTGSSYFVNVSNPNKIAPDEFFQKYIEPFFSKISKDSGNLGF